MARLGIAVLGPTCEVKVEVCGWEGKQQHLIYQRCRGRAGFHPDPGCVKELFASPKAFPQHIQHYVTPRACPRPTIRPPRMAEAGIPTQERGEPSPVSYDLL